MGFINVLFINVALWLAYWLHTIYNTPYDWMILMLMVSIAAFIYSDEPMLGLIAMVKWVHK